MEQINTRQWIWVACAILMTLILRWVNRHIVLEKDPTFSSGFSYEMPHPESVADRLDLSGREVDRQILENEKKAQAQASVKKAKVAQVVPPVVVPATVTTSSRVNSGQLTVRTVDTGRNSALSVTYSEIHSETNTMNPTNVKAGSIGPKADSSVANDNNSNTLKSPTEWLNLLRSTSSNIAVTEFITAHQNHQVNDAEFYSIAFELLLSNNTAQVQTGQALFSQDNSINAFSNVAQEYGLVPAAQRELVWNILLSFESSSKFRSLAASLLNSSNSIQSLALQVLGLAVTKAENQLTTQGTGSEKPAAVQSFLIFVPGLTSVAKSEPQNASTAQNLLSVIQALNSQYASN